MEPTGEECHARTVNETVLENVVVQAINTLLGDKSTYQTQLQQNIAKVIREVQKSTAEGIDEQLMELLKKANNKEVYDEIADRFSNSANSVKNAPLTPLPETPDCKN